MGVANENQIIDKDAQVQFVKFIFIDECTPPVFAIFENKEDCK